MKQQGQDKWYQGGLAFECQGCGACCSGPDEGYVWVRAKEIAALANLLKVSVSQFKARYVRRVGLRYSLIEKQPSKDCIFLKPTEKGKGCELYPQRPRQCRSWPFWPENLRSPAAWRRAAEKCPGIDKGPCHSVQQIELILDGHLAVAGQTEFNPQALCQWLRDNRDNQQCLTAVAQLYHYLDDQLAATNPSCKNCGRCCGFERFGHRLYATTLEMLYFQHGLSQNKNVALAVDRSNGCCPCQQDAGCGMYEYRPSGCRIFYCQAPAAYQNDLTEKALLCLRNLHEQFGAVYYYGDLRWWLDRLAGAAK